MQKTLIVLADLSGVKAFKLENNTMLRAPRLELIEHYNIPEAHARLVDRVSDQSGRFPGGSAGGPMSDGERHNIQLELRKRFVRQLAARINILAGGPEIERCFLAVSKEINHDLVAELQPQVRAKVQKNIPSDLMKIEPTAILGHF